VGLVMAIVGIGLGVSARRQIRKSEGWLVGDGIARAGIIVGTALLAIGIVVTAILLATHHSKCDHATNCSGSPHSGGQTTSAGARLGSRTPTASSTSRSRSAKVTPESTAPVASASTTAPNSAASPPVITLGVFGSGTASSIAVLDASGETEHTDVPLPYTTNSQLSGSYRVAIDAQSGSADPSASITCAINVPGKALVTHTSTGPYAVVHCDTDSGP
jgi:cytoskeletal protein RodZ